MNWASAEMQALAAEYARQRHILMERIRLVEEQEGGELRLLQLRRALMDLTYAMEQMRRYFPGQAMPPVMIVLEEGGGESVLPYT